ncbi:MAG TPA: prepilin-type N-terminal cleavage/methylation domain-containing protein [Candidatus Pacearchaeota archaeon]|nr:prepilin-type N-terminal cleavage/methylation domain-containing protein [Candidatus Pacearchaeota archaeon]
MTKQKSFTLIELLVVIVIIGILAGVIMISTSSSIDKANIAKSKVFEESVQNNLAANMVSRWTLDEIINTNKTPDQWGSNTGTLYGTNGLPQLRPASECVTDGCFKFDGVDDYVEVMGITIIGNVSLTMSFWAKSIANQSGDDVLVVYGNNGVPGECAGLYYRTTESYVKFTGWANASYDYSTSFVKDFNIWHHWIITYNGSQVLIYRDGVADSNGLQPKVLNFTVGNLLLGGNSVSRFNSLIDDVRIYNVALSFSQIKQNYIAGLNSMLGNGNMSNEEYNQRIEKLAQK